MVARLAWSEGIDKGEAMFAEVEGDSDGPSMGEEVGAVRLERMPV